MKNLHKISPLFSDEEIARICFHQMVMHRRVSVYLNNTIDYDRVFFQKRYETRESRAHFSRILWWNKHDRPQPDFSKIDFK